MRWPILVDSNFWKNLHKMPLEYTTSRRTKVEIKEVTRDWIKEAIKEVIKGIKGKYSKEVHEDDNKDEKYVKDEDMVAEGKSLVWPRRVRKPCVVLHQSKSVMWVFP